MRTVRWNHTSKKLFLFIISLLVIIPAFTITAIATDQTTDSFAKPYPLGLSIFSAIRNNNTTKDGSGSIAPLGGSDDPAVSENPEISISGTSGDNYPSTQNTNQPDTSPTDPMVTKIKSYKETLSACAAPDTTFSPLTAALISSFSESLRSKSSFKPRAAPTALAAEDPSPLQGLIPL